MQVDNQVVGQIGHGLVLFAAARAEDTEEDLHYLVDKTVNMRIFPDDAGRFDRSVLDMGGAILLVSQFTLYADTRKGRRPSFVGAAPPDQAEALIERLGSLLREAGVEVQTGRFRAHMQVEIHNDGPVTIWIDSEERKRARRG